MRAKLYQSIANRLRALPHVKHTALWSETLLAYPQEEIPYNTPAVFIEFEPIRWKHHTQGIREAEVVINLHVVTRTTIPGGEVDFLALPNRINAALHGLTIRDDGGVADALTSTLSTTDHNFDELMHTIETYTCHITDRSAVRQNTTAPATVKIVAGAV